MAAEEKAFKKLFLQRSVLDVLRIYLDPQPEFLKQMQENGLLKEEEVFVLKALPWPSNRNELMQILVKKPWSKATFNSLCAVLELTHEGILAKTLTEKADEIIPDALESAEAEAAIPVITPTKTNGINLHEINSINITLRDKDEELRKLKKEKEQLLQKLNNLTRQNIEYQQRYTVLDKTVSDWLAGLELEHAHDDVGSSLAELKSELTNQKSGLANMEVEKRKLRGSLSEEQRGNEMLTTQNKALTTELNNLKIEMATLIKEKKTQTESLKNELQDEKNKRQKLERNMKFMESINVESSRTSEKGYNQMKSQLNDTIKQMQTAVAERDAAHQEVADIRDKTRKLLFKLNLNHDHKIHDIPLALDHARDMVYNLRGRHQPSITESPTPRLVDNNTPRAVISPLIVTSGGKLAQVKCGTCGKSYCESSNYEGACVYHLPGAKKLHIGTKLEVWSCCKSRDSYKGCQLSRHKATGNSRRDSEL